MRTKLIIIIMTVALIPMIAIGITGYIYLQKTIEQDTLSHLESVAAIQRTVLEGILKTNEGVLEFITTRASLRASLSQYLTKRTASNRAILLEKLRDLHTSIRNIVNLWIIDTRGHVLASTDDKAIGKPFPLKALALDSLQKQGSSRLLPDGETIAFFITEPFQQNKGLHAWLVVQLSAASLLEAINNNTGLGETGETILAGRNEQGEPIFLAPFRHDTTTAFKPIPNRQDLPIMRALNGHVGVMAYTRDYFNREVFAATQYLPNAGWGIVAKITKSEVLLPLRHATIALIIASAIYTLLIIAASHILVKRFTQPILAITSAAQQFGKGDLTRRTPITSRDEVGILANAFNAMADEIEKAHIELENKVAQRTLELTRSNTDLEQFASVASHDLQEPLRKVTSFAELLQERYKTQLDEKADTYLSYIIDGAYRMQRLIKDLLQFSRISRGEFTTNRVNLGDVFARVITNLDTRLRDSHAIVSNDPLPIVTSYELHMEQLLQNLLENAIKFRSAAAPQVHLSCNDLGDSWQLAMKDNGIGIAHEYLEKIFIIFQRLHSRDAFPGTGIGLALCKRIVERHKGRIWAESEPGMGSTFFFTLPKKGMPDEQPAH